MSFPARLFGERRRNDILNALYAPHWHSGAEALEKCASFAPDVVILGIGPPDASGHDIAQRMCQGEREKALTLIALTSYGTQEDKEKAFAAGFDHHLTKPVSLDALIALLAHVEKRTL